MMKLHSECIEGNCASYYCNIRHILTTKTIGFALYAKTAIDKLNMHAILANIPQGGIKEISMHEGKHGILDGVDDIDDVFGTKDEHENDLEHNADHSHDHDHDKKGKKEEQKPHTHGKGCNC